MAKKATKVEKAMSKSEIVTEISNRTELSRKDVGRVFDELGSIIELHVSKKSVGMFTLPGLLKIKIVQRPARPARKGVPNPFKPGEWVGENMYYGGPAWGLTGVNAIEWFISEKQWYHHDDNTCSAPQDQACGHFTQVVWKSSQYVGCGEAIANGLKYYVCNYYPAGNNGQRPY